ncbi:MAG TPA: peptidoglycan-binding protein [Enhygromyxa sp.]|nr:peptidoglycan-binding protein [Enhygromyxa sp.]
MIHVVVPGDCLYRIAQQYGFADWRTIYDHPDNAEFRELRPNPNLIYPGDEIHIPEPEPKQVSLPTTKQHKIRLTRPKIMLRIELRDELDEPLADKAFMLEFGASIYEGTTTGEGLLEQKIRAGEERGQLTLWMTDDREGERYCWDVAVGHLDPVEELAGVRQRLNNLGYYCEPDGDELDDSLRLALRGFQHATELDLSGEPDDATRAKLVELHGEV